MDQEIASVINSVLCDQKAKAHIRIMYMKPQAKGAIAPVTHQDATVAMALAYRKVIINAARTDD
jgi:hypothetical protein